MVSCYGHILSFEAIRKGLLVSHWLLSISAFIKGADLVAVHKGRYYRRGDGLALGPGPFVAAIEYATGKKVIPRVHSSSFHY